MNKKIVALLFLSAIFFAGGPRAFAQGFFASAREASAVPEPLRELWQPGDWFVSNSSWLALIGGPGREPELKYAPSSSSPTALGSILSFVPRKGEIKNEINVGQPVIRLDDRPLYVAYRRLSSRPAGPEGTAVLEFEGEFILPDKIQLRILTAVRIPPDGQGLLLSSTLTNTGRREAKDLGFSLYAFAGTPYNFSPSQKDKQTRFNYRLFHKRDHSLAWVDLTPPSIGESPPPGTLAPGQAFTATYRLMADVDGSTLLGRVFDLLQVKWFPAKLRISGQKGRLAEVLVQDFSTSAILYRDFWKDTPLATLPLPQGAYIITANVFPAVVEGRLVVAPDGENTCVLNDPPRGKVMVKIRDGRGGAVPGKVTFIGLRPTLTPYFEPENPRQTERGWEAFKNSCYPPQTGQEVVLPTGTYLVVASRGPEYTVEHKVLEVLENSSQEVVFRIERVLNPPGLISLDPHLHTTCSDADVDVPQRLRSIVAQGLEAALATDHNRVTDYETDLRKLGLERDLAVRSGREVTSAAAGIHFNVYPAVARDLQKDERSFLFEQKAASPLFRDARERNSGAAIQLNHPRAGNLGYFNNSRLDQEAAAFALNTLGLDFDLMEVLNGPFAFASNAVAVEDWLHLLNRGRYYPLVGSSDSHTADGEEPGYSRTFVHYGGPRAEALDWGALFESLRKGKSFASNGPLLDFRVNGATLGEMTKADSGRVDISLEVSAAPWISVDEVRLIINGERKIVFPVKNQDSLVRKFRERISLRLERDSYLVLEVLGRKTLYPVVQQPAATGQLRDAALPYALSNPIFVDVDGNGHFNPPWPVSLELKEDVPAPAEKVLR